MESAGGRNARHSTSSIYMGHDNADEEESDICETTSHTAMTDVSLNTGSASAHVEQIPMAQNTSQSNGNDMQAVVLPIIKFAKRFIPVIILLATKVLFEHRIGILLTLSMYLVFLYADKRFRDSVARRTISLHQKCTTLLCLWFILVGSVASVYWVFIDEHLERSLVFLEPADKLLKEFWSTLFVCVVTDFTLMYFSVFIKTVISLFATTCVRRRGHLFELAERCALLYRELPIAACWLRYFVQLGTDVFTVALLIIYIIMKLERIYVRFTELLGCVRRFGLSATHGYPANHNEVSDAGGVCPICHDDYCEPIKLTRCAHLYCNQCIALWFDRERSCPICRTAIVEKSDWRDGSTCGLLHVW